MVTIPSQAGKAFGVRERERPRWQRGKSCPPARLALWRAAPSSCLVGLTLSGNPELEYFSRCILEDRAPEPDAEEGIDDQRVIEAILKSAHTGAAVSLPPRQRIRRPSLAQESSKRAVGKQETIHAPSPSVK